MPYLCVRADGVMLDDVIPCPPFSDVIVASIRLVGDDVVVGDDTWTCNRSNFVYVLREEA